MSDDFDQLISTFTSYYHAGDTKALANLFTKEAVILPPNESPARGQHCVIDFGAGHSHYEDKLVFTGVKEALAEYQNIILLLPSADLDRSVSLLRQRSIEERNDNWIHDGYDFIEHCVKDDCNHDLATSTTYTDGKTPEQTCEEILAIVNVEISGRTKIQTESVYSCSLFQCSLPTPDIHTTTNNDKHTNGR